MSTTLKPTRPKKAADCAHVKPAPGSRPASLHVAASTRPETKGSVSTPGEGGRRPPPPAAAGVDAYWMASVAASTQ